MTGHDYTNRQNAPFFWFLSLLAVGCFIGGRASEPEFGAVVTCYSLSAVFALLAVMFMWLETSDQGDHLLVHFGPLPIARRRVRYERIRAVRRDRSRLIEGWGIHLGPRGWIWNLWGREVVELDLDKGRLRIGTDDPEGLTAFLQDRCNLN
ncbi:MAG: hypothetical protein HRU14_07020 [Planctomycetes bacterium]|nr:hypothetical protein [Planctomycetota bacterium]